MSTEEQRERDRKVIFERCEKLGIGLRGSVDTLAMLLGHECIEYGRAYPDREMLKKFAATIDIDEAMLRDDEIEAFVDQFLSSLTTPQQEEI